MLLADAGVPCQIFVRSLHVVQERFVAASRARLPKAGASPEAIIRQHAAVLGLASLILAFPYELPAWLPDVIEAIALRVNDPAPIQVRRPPRVAGVGPFLVDADALCAFDVVTALQNTVKKTLAEFRRTHQDTWHLDKLAFTDDQLSMLTDLLVSPGYYA